MRMKKACLVWFIATYQSINRIASYNWSLGVRAKWSRYSERTSFFDVSPAAEQNLNVIRWKRKIDNVKRQSKHLTRAVKRWNSMNNSMRLWWLHDQRILKYDLDNFEWTKKANHRKRKKSVLCIQFIVQNSVDLFELEEKSRALIQIYRYTFCLVHPLPRPRSSH